MTVTDTHAPTSFDVFQTAMDLVIGADSAQDLCRKLVHSDLLSRTVRGAYLYSLNDRSNLVETTGYGDRFSEIQNEISTWDENPVSISIRTKRDVFISGDTEHTRSAVVSLPLIKDSIPTGALVLILAPDAEESPIPSEVTPAIGKLGAFFLETRGFVIKSGAIHTGRESVEDLTTRQVTILGFMGDGLTNAEISQKVLLSESTVRQETIRIYRALAVSGRQEAVAKARALGLIQKLAFAAHTPSD